MDKLAERMQQRLNSDPRVSRFEIQVIPNCQTIELKGKVRTFYDKQMAQEIIKPLLEEENETRRLVNNVVVPYNKN